MDEQTLYVRLSSDGEILVIRAEDERGDADERERIQ